MKICKKLLKDLVEKYNFESGDDLIKAINDNSNKINWKDISVYKFLSEGFIREFQDKVDWDKISFCQILSEDFIREFQDKVDWFFISYKQILSEDFIREFQHRVYLIIGRI